MTQLRSDQSQELHLFAVRWPVLIFFVIGMAVLLAFLLTSVWWMAERIQSELLEEDIQQVGTQVNNLLDQEKIVLHGHLSVIAHVQPLSEAFLAGDREKLLAVSRPILAGLQKQEITRWVFYRADLTNFLRVHNPEKYGDQTNSPVVQNARKTGQFTFAVEAGKSGVPTFRGVIPWQVNGKTVGYLELNKESVPLIDRVRERANVQLFSFFHKKFLDKEAFLAGCQRLNLQAHWESHPDLVQVSPAGAPVPQEVQEYLDSNKWQSAPFQHSGSIIAHAGNPDQPHHKHLMFSIPVQNAEGITVMRVIASAENHSLQLLFQSQSLLYAKLAAAITLLMGWIFYQHLGKVESRIQKTALHILTIEASLTKAQQIAHLGNWEWRPDLATLICSEQVRQIIAWDEATPATTLDALFAGIHPEDQAMAQAALKRFLASTRETLDLEYRLVRQDDEWRYIHLRAEAKRASNAPAPTSLFGTLQDVTKLKQLELTARKNAAFLQHALENTEQGILLTDERGKIVFYNNSFLSMWRIPEEIAAGGREKKILDHILPQLLEPTTFLGRMKPFYTSAEVGSDLLLLKDGRQFRRHTHPIMGETVIMGREWRFTEVTPSNPQPAWNT